MEQEWEKAMMQCKATIERHGLNTRCTLSNLHPGEHYNATAGVWPREEQPVEAKRDHSGVRYDIIMPEFENFMAKIGFYGAQHYGDFNWQKSRLTGNKSPINHIREHLYQYQINEPYDHPEIGIERKIHLAAIAFNAMMEFWYEENMSNVSTDQS